jgi:hypothetical protein
MVAHLQGENVQSLHIIKGPDCVNRTDLTGRLRLSPAPTGSSRRVTLGELRDDAAAARMTRSERVVCGRRRPARARGD